MKIRVNDPRVVHLPPVKNVGGKDWDGVMLEPGVNDVPDEYMKALDKHEGVAAHFEEGTCQTDPSKALLELADEKSKPLIPASVKTTLAELSPRNAAELIKDSAQSQLVIWAANEKRPEVIKAIRARLEELKASSAE